MSKTPLKKIIKAKIKGNKELTKEEVRREKIKYEIAEELGLKDKVDEYGWGGLTAEETGRIGGIMTKRKKIFIFQLMMKYLVENKLTIT